jgi:hypothetical protein
VCITSSPKTRTTTFKLVNLNCSNHKPNNNIMINTSLHHIKVPLNTVVAPTHLPSRRNTSRPWTFPATSPENFHVSSTDYWLRSLLLGSPYFPHVSWNPASTISEFCTLQLHLQKLEECAATSPGLVIIMNGSIDSALLAR